MPAFGRLGRRSWRSCTLKPSPEPGPKLRLKARVRARSVRVGRSCAALVVVLAALFTSATPAAALSGVTWPTQSLGDRGTDVFAIQSMLRDRLIPHPLPHRASIIRAIVLPPVDGFFGAATEDAVRRFQTSYGLIATGVVDGPTWLALVMPLGIGAEGPEVSALQRELIEKRRAPLIVDGIFDTSTRAAVIAFQRHVGLAQTGSANDATWRALVWLYELPRFTASALCDYSVGNGPANWGKAETIASLEVVGAWSVRHGFGRVAVGDVSFENGGALPGHETHRVGLDADIRPLRKANDQCTQRTNWRSTTYDRAATRALVKAIRALAPGHIKLIYFNDPVLVREGLTTTHAGHDDHLHIRFCETIHPLAAYDC